MLIVSAHLKGPSGEYVWTVLARKGKMLTDKHTLETQTSHSRPFDENGVFGGLYDKSWGAFTEQNL